MPDSVELAAKVIEGLQHPRAHGGSRIAEAMSASLSHHHHFHNGGNLSTDFRTDQTINTDTMFSIFKLNPKN